MTLQRGVKMPGASAALYRQKVRAIVTTNATARVQGLNITNSRCVNTPLACVCPLSAAFW
jgi:hypothetical protein